MPPPRPPHPSMAVEMVDRLACIAERIPDRSKSSAGIVSDSGFHLAFQDFEFQASFVFHVLSPLIRMYVRTHIYSYR